MNKEIISQAAQQYADSSFKHPVNSEGEKLSIPPGHTNPYGYRKHCKSAEKHFKAGVAWHKSVSIIKTIDNTDENTKVTGWNKLLKTIGL